MPAHLKTLPIFFVLFVTLIFSSCNSTYRTARTFLEQRNQFALMIVPPTNTFLYYYPFEETPDEDGAEIEYSMFLKDLNTERASELFLKALYEQLADYNLKVYGPEEFEEFLSYNGKRYIFTIAQTEIVEAEKPQTFKALIDTILYRQDFLLQNVERNTWFEFVVVDENTENPEMEVLYSTFAKSDYIDGQFRYRAFSGEVFYEYTAHPITLEDVYQLNSMAGSGSGRYIFEYLMNRYVEKNTGKTMDSMHYKYHKDEDVVRRSKTDQRFIILESSETGTDNL